jgi:hypothetical protein
MRAGDRGHCPARAHSLGDLFVVQRSLRVRGGEVTGTRTVFQPQTVMAFTILCLLPGVVPWRSLPIPVQS